MPTHMNVKFDIRQISATPFARTLSNKFVADICLMLQIFALFVQAVADICLIWTGVALFPLQEMICAACQEYKSLQTSVFSSVALGLLAYQHQLTLELISLGSLF